MLRSLVGSEMCIRDSINAEYGGLDGGMGVCHDAGGADEPIKLTLAVLRASNVQPNPESPETKYNLTVELSNLRSGRCCYRTEILNGFDPGSSTEAEFRSEHKTVLVHDTDTLQVQLWSRGDDEEEEEMLCFGETGNWDDLLPAMSLPKEQVNTC
eukprot:TRINITY_DN6063_c0_g1_i5.p1 TRINITY_DN6063_c0_g1~~TRINITY_DN6063_c0_g1_i5.p1  ORF type:complete len:155 (+),score=50.54 TRINITY_DN6063_c0_g1_i5:163-627(+)